MIYHSFTEKLSASKCAAAAETDAATIRNLLSKVVDVCQATESEDKSGVDYIVELAGGRRVCVDVKSREEGCSRYWKRMGKNGKIPECAIETVSASGPHGAKKIGWSLDHEKRTDLILYRWHHEDCKHAVIVCFHTLRITTERMLPTWRSTFRETMQHSGQWISQSLFIPADILLTELRKTMVGQLPDITPSHPTYLTQLAFGFFEEAT